MHFEVNPLCIILSMTFFIIVFHLQFESIFLIVCRPQSVKGKILIVSIILSHQTNIYFEVSLTLKVIFTNILKERMMTQLFKNGQLLGQKTITYRFRISWNG